jgi:hypothetical protein
MERKDTSISLDRQTASKLKILADKSRFSQVELIRQWVEACFQLATEGVEESGRVSMLSWFSLKDQIVVTAIRPVHTNLAFLDSETRRKVEEAFGYRRGEHGELIDTTEREKPIPTIDTTKEPESFVDTSETTRKKSILERSGENTHSIFRDRQKAIDEADQKERRSA